MTWQEYIHSDPEILTGKPVIRGTRLSIDFIFDLFASGWTEKEVLENYSSLTKEALQAVFSFSLDRDYGEFVYKNKFSVIDRTSIRQRPLL